MQIHSDRSAIRTLSRRVPCAALLLCLALAGCGDPDSLESIFERQLAGDYEGTIEPLRDKLAENPDDPQVNFLYGRALASTERRNLATWPLRRAMEDPEWMVPAGLVLAQSALASADYNVVIDVTGQVLEREPDNAIALLLRSKAQAHWRKDPEAAIADARRVLELNPDAVEAYEPMILALLVLEDEEGAREAFAQLGRRIEEVESPESTRAWYCGTTAIFAKESEELERARELWEQCTEEYPAAAEVVWAALEFYDGQGEFDRSIEVLRGALEALPAGGAYRVALADRLRVAGRPEEGEALLREATKDDDPGRASNAWMDLGRFHRVAADWSAAADAFERGVQLAQQVGPVGPPTLFTYADALVLAGRFERAEQIADAMTVPAHRHIILARVAQERGNPARALQHYDEGLRLWPDNPWTRYYAARAAEQLGQFERAIAEYRHSIRIDAAATDARTRAALLLLAEGDPAEALQTARVIKGKALEPAGLLLALRLRARLGLRANVKQALESYASEDPLRLGVALAEAARGAAEGRRGPKAALELLRSDHGIDLKDPRNAHALHALVRYAHRAGALDGVPPEVDAALEAYPGTGVLLSVRALALELSGAPKDAVRTAYDAALEQDEGEAWALAGLGRLALPDDPERALALLERAAAVDPSDPEPALWAAKALVAAERFDEATERLDALLGDQPTYTPAAAYQVEIDLDRGVASNRTLERAMRWVRFGGGSEALEQLSRVHAQRGEAEQAEKVAARAQSSRGDTPGE